MHQKRNSPNDRLFCFYDLIVSASILLIAFSVLVEIPTICVFFNRNFFTGGDLFHFGIIYFLVFNSLAVITAFVGLLITTAFAADEPVEYAGFSKAVKRYFLFYISLVVIFGIIAYSIGKFL